MSLVPSCRSCSAPVDAYGRDNGICKKCKEKEVERTSLAQASEPSNDI